jgi:hypothetical protein
VDKLKIKPGGVWHFNPPDMTEDVETFDFTGTIPIGDWEDDRQLCLAIAQERAVRQIAGELITRGLVKVDYEYDMARQCIRINHRVRGLKPRENK